MCPRLLCVFLTILVTGFSCAVKIILQNVWNLPFNGISVAMGGITVDQIVSDPGLRKLADIVMDETIAACNADLAKIGHEEFFLGDDDKKKMFELSDGMGPYRTSTMIDLTNRNPMEVEFLFKKAVQRANRLGVPVPHLETLVYQIEAFQRCYNLF
jgi:2-dehydropantoate 2-reductase